MRYLYVDSPTGGSGTSTLAVLLAFAASNTNRTVALVASDDDGCGDILAAVGLPHVRHGGVYCLPGVDLYDLTKMGDLFDYDVVIFDRCRMPVPADVATQQIVLVDGPSYNGLRKAAHLPADLFVIRTHPDRILDMVTARSSLNPTTPVVEWANTEAIARAADAGAHLARQVDTVLAISEALGI